jgi:hypothetical protein
MNGMERWWMLVAVACLALAAGCTSANPYYHEPGDGAADIGDGGGDTPPPADGRDEASPPADDGGGEIAPADDGSGGDADDVVDAEDDGPPDGVGDVVVEADGGVCGDGRVDPGEECDDASEFCVACALATPAGWVRCTDAAGHPAFFLLETWAGNHTALEFRDHCQALVEGMSPAGFAFYGLGLFYDEDLWNCVLPSLDEGTQYWTGASQDRAATDYGEPDAGWYWTGYDGAGWADVTPYDDANTYLAESFNDAGGTGNVDCARIQHGWGGWSLPDYSCTTTEAWSGICMIRF